MKEVDDLNGEMAWEWFCLMGTLADIGRVWG